MAREDDEEHWVYTIEVEGTDICEYYDMPEPLSKQQVEKIWLADVREKGALGPRLASKFAGLVKVTKLWTESQESAEDRILNSRKTKVVRVSQEDVEARLK